MLPRLQAQAHEVRLDLRRRWLEREERAALRRLGERVVEIRDPGGSEELRRLAAEIGKALERIEALGHESRASLEADRADLARVAAWMRPVVAVRGTCARLVLRHRRQAARRELHPRHEVLGRLAADPESGAACGEILRLRADLGRVAAERKRRIAPFGGSALPDWTGRAGEEAAGFGRALWNQLLTHLVPKAPALAGMVAGWWIANTYTDSHLRSVLHSVGIGSGGTRVVSGSTYRAMSFWLPLLAAALCAYLGERLAAYCRGDTRLNPSGSDPESG